MRSNYSLGMVKDASAVTGFVCARYSWFKHYPKMKVQWQYVGSNKYLTQFTPNLDVISKVHLAHNATMLYTEYKELL